VSSSRVIKWEGGKKKSPTEEKKKIFLVKSFFFCRVLRKSSKRKEKIISFFFVFIFKNRTGILTIHYTSVFAVCSCEVVMCRLVLEMMKVHFTLEGQPDRTWLEKKK